MIRLIILLLLLAYIPAHKGYSQETDAKAAFPLKNIGGTSSISFRTDGADLSQLEEAVGDKKIVWLGEFFHSEATTFSAKARVVRYLIEKMGFSVLAYEVSFSDTYRLFRQNPDKDDLLSYMFSNDLSVSREEYNFWKYVYAMTRHPTKKIEFTGFDVDIGYSGYGFICFLEHELREIAPVVLEDKAWQTFKEQVLNINELKQEDCQLLSSKILKYISLIESTGYPDILRKGKLVQMLKNLRGLANFITYKPPYPDNIEGLSNFYDIVHFHALRDKQMADNLDMILNTSLASGKKVIVWSSTYHASRNITELPNQAADTAKFQPMGQLIWNKYAKEMYSIAFVGYKKTIGNIKHRDISKQIREETVTIITNEKGEQIGQVTNKPPTAIDTLDIMELPVGNTGSIEKFLHDKGYKFAFTDISRQLKEREFYMFPTFDQPYRVAWSKLFDGIYFMDKIEPFHTRFIYDYNASGDYIDKVHKFWPKKADCGVFNFESDEPSR